MGLRRRFRILYAAAVRIIAMVSTPSPTSAAAHLQTPQPDAPSSVQVEMKNSDRMQSLRARMRAHVDTTFQTGPMARVMRRDWNIVSAKLYVHAIDPAYRKRIEDDIVEMCWQVDDTADEVRAMPFQRLDRSWLHPRRMQLEVVHPLTARWLRAMMTMDELFALLVSAEKAGMITRRKRHAILLPCQVTYLAFKATAMKMSFSSGDALLSDLPG